MAIVVPCPGCKQSLKVPDQAAGKKVKCPKCSAAVGVPMPPAANESSAESFPQTPSSPQRSTKQKSHLALWLGLGVTAFLVGLILVVCLVAVFFLTREPNQQVAATSTDTKQGDKQPSSKTPPNKNTPQDGSKPLADAKPKEAKTQSKNAQGVATYNVTLFNGVGQGNAVVVNVEEPTYAERALYGGTTDGSRWLSILEKAYVTQWPRNNDPLFGIQIDTGPVYDVAANGERMDRALIRVTGRAAQIMQNQWVLPNAPILRGILATVNDNQNSALILVQSRTAGQLAQLPANMMRLRSLPQNHAYAVVRWTPRGLNDGVIRLRNPWNNGTTFGGEFDVTLQEFLRVFVNISRQTP